MVTIKRYRHKIISLGVDETTDPSEVKYIALLNSLSFIAMFFCLGYLPAFVQYLPESRIFLIIALAAFPFCLAVLLLNYLQYYLAARLLFNLFAVSFFVIVPVLGGRPFSLHLLMVLVIIAAFFIYPSRQKFIMYAVIAAAVAGYLGVEAWLFGHEGLLRFSVDFQRAGAITNNSLLIIYTLAFLFYVYTIYLRAEKQSDALLYNILPAPIANRLKLKQETIADSFSECSVLFADIVNFTNYSERISPEHLVTKLNEIFSKFDDLVDKHGLEKIKTIGDAYMVVAGLPSPVQDHAAIMAEFALDMKDAMQRLGNGAGNALRLRIGMHSGPVVAGIIGKKKFIYDLWGDTVNTASRMESHGLPDEIQVTTRMFELIKDRYVLTERGCIDVKGKGQIRTYLLKGRSPRVL